MIAPAFARLLAREHRYRPIKGDVLSLGRQTIELSYDEAIRLLTHEGVTVATHGAESYDRDDHTRYGKGHDYVRDDAFFRLFGVSNARSLDVSAYEGADIVHDLNRPVPQDLHDRFDFILDGGTFDHLVDLRVALENVTSMLRTGGRILQWNAASNFTGSSYLSFGPDFFWDYYVINGFRSVKVFVAEGDGIAAREGWDFYEYLGGARIDHFPTDRIQLTVVLAEKSERTITSRLPIENYYRDERLKAEYATAEARLERSDRRWFTAGQGAGFSLQTRPRRSVLDLFSGMTVLGVRGCVKKAAEKMGKRMLSWSRDPGSESPRGFRYVGTI